MRQLYATTGKFTVAVIMQMIGFVSAAEVTVGYPFQPVPFTAVTLTDSFWQPRIETNRIETIPFAFEQCEKTGRIDNFKIAAGLMKSPWQGEFGFNDTDLYKTIEGASYSLMSNADLKLDAYLDQLVSYIAAAQEPDGYLYTPWTARARDSSGTVNYTYTKERWDNLLYSHELYNAGHMYEAAVAHYMATGKRSFLDVAIRNADLICQTFGPGENPGVPGHQEIELGLVKLYRITGEVKYLQQAKWFLDQRGRRGHKSHYVQSHIPVTEQAEAVGHAVRAGYMYSGMADVAALTGDSDYSKAIDMIWHNLANKKLYITGGAGADLSESFGKDYELPNATAYAETCANIANVFWNFRMFLLHGDSKYIDVMERALYNSVLSGVSIDGKLFFYPNPLQSEPGRETGRIQYERSPWFDCACCPGNIARFLPSIPGYLYAVRSNEVYVNLYSQSSAKIEVNRQKLKLSQKTHFPWSGQVIIEVNPEVDDHSFTLKLRVPDWATNEFTSSRLYSFAEPLRKSVSVFVNQKEVLIKIEKGYIPISRSWKMGDTVQINLPMTVRRIRCDERVKDNVGKIALQRGPLVYCIEWLDIQGGNVLDLKIEKDLSLNTAHRPNLLGGITVIQGTGVNLKKVKDGQIRETDCAFEAIPYYSWAHRGKGQMTVWIPIADGVH
jgi:DUF1680 family protein